ncbi:hypothetical protein [Streptomyces xiaopingdaonensis]|uniref:hypothetical protein n=1 Tax=Streptomyces xiaopingdaonensis TaxID=1565415 RepID=UPI0002FDCDD9|nr:hypothetical protein [Streptomyces xiaopingdaonensis]
MRTSLLTLLDQKGLTLTQAQLDLVHETQDLGILTSWHTRALHTTAPDEIFTCE